MYSDWHDGGLYDGATQAQGMTLADLIKAKADDPSLPYGLDHVELPPNTPLCAALWDRICTRFSERYYKRYLSGETLDEWQRLLQVRTDEIVPRIERAMRLYAANDIDADLIASQVTEYLDLKDTGTSGSSGKNSGKTTVTPDQSINESENFAGQTSSSSSESSGTTSNTRTGKVKTTQTTQGGIIPQINLSIEEWLDLETLLIDRYSSCFMSFIWS